MEDQYKLWIKYNGQVSEYFSPTIRDLALQTYRALPIKTPRHYPGEFVITEEKLLAEKFPIRDRYHYGMGICLEAEAFTPDGKTLNVRELYLQGKNICSWGSWKTSIIERCRWNGEGPVPGVHKFKFGGDRPIHTTQERRMASGVVKEEGEVETRASRNSHNLPSNWDSYSGRQEKKSWKSKRKGRKAWNR